MVSEAIFKAIYGKGPKILTPKEMRQRLPLHLLYQLLKYRTNNWVEINDNSRGACSTKSQIEL